MKPYITKATATEVRERYISWSEAVRLQGEIHRRLKQEIEEGLYAGARYWQYYDDGTIEDNGQEDEQQSAKG